MGCASALPQIPKRFAESAGSVPLLLQFSDCIEHLPGLTGDLSQRFLCLFQHGDVARIIRRPDGVSQLPRGTLQLLGENYKLRLQQCAGAPALPAFAVQAPPDAVLFLGAHRCPMYQAKPGRFGAVPNIWGKRGSCEWVRDYDQRQEAPGR